MSKKWEAVQTIAKTNDFPFGACLAKQIVASGFTALRSRRSEEMRKSDE